MNQSHLCHDTARKRFNLSFNNFGKFYLFVKVPKKKLPSLRLTVCLTQIGDCTDARPGMRADYAADAAYLRTDDCFFF